MRHRHRIGVALLVASGGSSVSACSRPLSLVPPLFSGADAATVTALLGLHLVAAAVMIPALVRSLRRVEPPR
ncbi:DUF6069 family protein [Nocardioides ferulae]|uniref:DUF6069 family protein n=1 Tax=Nocardioides ferulae TaxID=2340821 RepID=UPI000EB41693|nr:DUF6069 family protein [Nocardioides ferulae]